MRFEEFKQAIVGDDSEWSYDDETGLYVNLDDIRCTIQSVRDNVREEFYEDWVETFPDKQAYKGVFNLCFNGSLIERFYTAGVDGYRMYIPLPDRVEMTISQEQYKIGSILNSFRGERFDDYLRMAGITVKTL